MAFDGNDTWLYDGIDWRKQQAAAHPPSGGVMEWDDGVSRDVYVGSVNSPAETWTWDGHVWSHLSPPTQLPSMIGHRLAYHAGTKTLVLFGNYNSDGGTTWTFEGSDWKAHTGGIHPSERASEGLSRYDSGGVVLLFGGSPINGPAVNDTWSWDGTTWTQLRPPRAPSARFKLGYGTGMAYDPLRHEVVLFGGDDGVTPAEAGLNDTWTWSGTSWARR